MCIFLILKSKYQPTKQYTCFFAIDSQIPQTLNYYRNKLQALYIYYRKKNIIFLHKNDINMTFKSFIQLCTFVNIGPKRPSHLVIILGDIYQSVQGRVP